MLAKLAFALTAFAALASAPARAAIQTFVANDPGASLTTPRPNSNAAAASFDAALGAPNLFGTVTWEGLPDGYQPTYTPNPGVTVSLSGWATASTRIKTGGDGTFGFNTTAGGTKSLQLLAPSGGTGVALFTFAQPVNSFGGYFTGIGTNPGDVTVQFNDGTARSYVLPEASNGGAAFFGFVNADALVTNVSVVQTGTSADFFAIDDLRYGAVVPEPAAIGAIGAASVALLARRRGR